MKRLELKTAANASYSCAAKRFEMDCHLLIAGKDPYDEAGVDSPKNEAKQSIRKIIGPVFKNPPLLWLTLAESFRNATVFIIASFATYYFTYVLRDAIFLWRSEGRLQPGLLFAHIRLQSALAPQSGIRG